MIFDPSTTITFTLTLCDVPQNCSDEECDYKEKMEANSAVLSRQIICHHRLIYLKLRHYRRV